MDHAQLAEAIKRLPAKHQEVLSIRYEHDISVPGIATIMSMDEAEVRRILRAALEALGLA